MTLDKVPSKSASLRSLLVRAWRERWSDMTWGIQIKTVLPRGGSGDAYNLADLILGQALVGPTPNRLVLSYLDHSLASHLVSHVSVLHSISRIEPVESKPHCVSALLDFLSEKCSLNLTSKGKGSGEECVQLATALLHLTIWLLKVVVYAFEALIEAAATASSAAVTHPHKEVHTLNYKNALGLLQTLILDKEFCVALFYVGKAEEKESFIKVLNLCKQILDLSKSAQSFSDEFATLKQDLIRLTNAVKTMDPTTSFRAAAGVQLLSNDPLFMTSAIQPLLAFEALNHPTSDLTNLAQNLNTVALVHGLNFGDLVYEVLRCMLLSISEDVRAKENFQLLKWHAFILVRFPMLLEKLFKLMKPSSYELKTPTDLYRAFDKILSKNESLLDAVDVRCKCSIVDILLKVVGRAPMTLMTETESEDVRKKRAKINDWTKSLQDSFFPNSRSFEMVLKAEATISSILQTLDSDYSKPDSLENLLGVLCHIIKGESFDLLLSASAANGKLKPFIESMIRFNQQSQESQGESVKNSLLRAALFDITFLMLVHVVQTFGSDVILREAKGTFIERWIKEMLIEEDRVKSLQPTPMGDNMVDNLLQQLSNGELRTQVVKWQNVCINVPMVMREMIVARTLGDLSKEMYTKMATTLCSKLSALPVCVMSWLSSFELCIPDSTKINVKALKSEFMAIATAAATTTSTTAMEDAASVMPHTRERSALMNTIIKKITKNDAVATAVAAAAVAKNSEEDSTLNELLLKLWQRVSKLGWLDINSVTKFKDLLRIGGSKWLVSVLIEGLLSVVYQEDIDNCTELIIAIFHVDLEQCTMALLLHVIPSYLTYREKNLKLTDPHGTALAKVAVSCIYAILMAAEKKSIGFKRRFYEDFEESSLPAVKVRRLNNDEAEDVLDGLSSATATALAAATATAADDVMVQAVTEFLRTLQNWCQESTVITPCLHFAVRLLEQAALRGRSKSARLIFSHLSMGLVSHLIKIVPDLFSYGLITKLFDLSSSGGRKSMARFLCLLRNIKLRNES